MVLVVADPDWYAPPGHERDGALPPRPVPRPVVWEGTTRGLDALRRVTAGWFARVRGKEPDPLDVGLGPVADHEDDDDDSGEWPVPRPVWRLDGAAAVPVDLGGDVHALAVVDGVAFGVLRRPSDPLIKYRDPGGWIACYYPGVVVRWEPATGVQVVAEVEDCSGDIVVDGNRVWLIGLSREDEFEDEPVRELDTSRLTLGAPIPLEIGAPVGVCNGAVLELDETLAMGGAGPIVGCRLLRRPTRGGRALRPIELPPVERAVHNAGGDLWFRVQTRPELVCVDPTGGVRHIRVDLVCRAYAPPATVPDGFDVRWFEADELEGLRAVFFGGMVDGHGGNHPFISGVEFTSVKLRASFPATEVVALFRATTRLDTRFGRRWNLYDDLGNPDRSSMQTSG